jgi:hypothetical protein
MSATSAPTCGIPRPTNVAPRGGTSSGYIASAHALLALADGELTTPPRGRDPPDMERKRLPGLRTDSVDMLDPEGQFFVLGRVSVEEMLSLGEVIEAGSRVVGVEILHEYGDQKARWLKLRSESCPSNSPMACRSPLRSKSNSRTPVRRVRTVFISVYEVVRESLAWLTRNSQPVASSATCAPPLAFKHQRSPYRRVDFTRSGATSIAPSRVRHQAPVAAAGLEDSVAQPRGTGECTKWHPLCLNGAFVGLPGSRPALRACKRRRGRPRISWPADDLPYGLDVQTADLLMTLPFTRGTETADWFELVHRVYEEAAQRECCRLRRAFPVGGGRGRLRHGRELRPGAG